MHILYAALKNSIILTICYFTLYDMSRPAIRVHGPHRIISEPITFSLQVFINFRTKVKNKACRRLCTDGSTALDTPLHSRLPLPAILNLTSIKIRAAHVTTCRCTVRFIRTSLIVSRIWNALVSFKCPLLLFFLNHWILEMGRCT